MTKSDRRIQPKLAMVMALLTTISSLLATSCGNPQKSGGTAPVVTAGTPTGTYTSVESSKGLKIGSLFSNTGDLASIAQPLPGVVKLAVETVNSCGGINGAPVTLVSEDDQSDQIGRAHV